MANEWEIKSRGDQCSVTGRPFAEGEYFYTLLFRERDGFTREDMCEEARQSRDQSKSPYSFWRTKFEPPPPPAPETLAKHTAEDLLRRLMLEDGPQHTNARYILALMLERKRQLKQIEAKDDNDGSRTLIYEHVKSGEVFVIPDPQLHLHQIEQVQMQVAELLAAG